jgi:hypothetical protein
VIVVELTDSSVAALVPKLTVLVRVNPVPVIVTLPLRPTSGPVNGA